MAHYRSNHCIGKLLTGTLVFLALFLPEAVLAAPLPVWEFGLRGGMEDAGTEENYRAGELYLLRALPWQGSVAGGTLATRFDLGVGMLEAIGDRGAWLAAGGDLVWRPGEWPVELEVGFRPLWLIDHRYGQDDFGGDMQFASHVGLSLRINPLVMSYRFMHLSNAGLYDENGGLNLHLFGVGMRF